jgi:subtilisin family serine protease
MSSFVFLTLFLFLSLPLSAKETAMYRLTISDKGNTPYSVDNPENFLSQKSIERRIKQNYQIDETDLPIDPAYLQAIENTGANIQVHSKWVNTIVVHVPNREVKNKLVELPFVNEITKVWKGNFKTCHGGLDSPFPNNSEEKKDFPRAVDFHPEDYGDAFLQLAINNAFPLHQLGYRGNEKTIAVLDGGFSNIDQLPEFFDSERILGVKNFTHHTIDFYRIKEDHGTTVLSCLAANNPGKMIGTAPFADYYLFNTEVIGEEFPIEEDYWIAALEYADSLGVDIVTSSLGYFLFDDPSMNHTWDKLDGYTVPASRAASMAIRKGMLLFHSAGNQGDGKWERITIPGDAKYSLTVGAIANDSIRVPFSSWGLTADNRIKPDVMALGARVCVVNGDGKISFVSGTSFATPVLAGMAACLWEAFPTLSNYEILKLIKESSDSYTEPDEYRGYGIPNFLKAFEKGKIAVKNLVE